MASTSKEEFYTKEELEQIPYDKLLKLDKMYSFRTSKKTKSTSMKADAIIKRLVKNGVPKFSRTYAFNRPLVKPLPSGTSLSSDVVELIYSMKKTLEQEAEDKKQEIEDRAYEIECVKAVFQPKTLPTNDRDFFNLLLNGSVIRLPMTDPNFRMHVVNLYDPNYFIKDYKYLAHKLKVNAKKMRENGVRYTQGELRKLNVFFSVNVIFTYSLIIVIENIIQKIEAYRKSHPALPKYPQEVASRLLQESYERYYWPPNNPINVLKIYIKELNKMLSKLRSYKIMLENSIIKHLNKRLDKLNTYLVEPDPSIVGQANAKFYIRILENSSKYLTKTRNGSSPHKKSKKTTQKRVKSF
jgi:hypothetical protein